MKTITLKQEWTEVNGEWESTGFAEPLGYELLEVTQTDKHGHPIEAIFEFKTSIMTAQKKVYHATLWGFTDIQEPMIGIHFLAEDEADAQHIIKWLNGSCKPGDSFELDGLSDYSVPNACEMPDFIKPKTDHEIITDMCITFNHSYGAPDKSPERIGGMTAEEKQFLYGQMKQVYFNDIKPLM